MEKNGRSKFKIAGLLILTSFVLIACSKTPMDRLKVSKYTDEPRITAADRAYWQWESRQNSPAFQEAVKFCYGRDDNAICGVIADDEDSRKRRAGDYD